MRFCQVPQQEDHLLPCSQGNNLVISFAVCFTKKAPLRSFLRCSQDDGGCHAETEGLAVARERQLSARHLGHVSTCMHWYTHEHI